MTLDEATKEFEANFAAVGTYEMPPEGIKFHSMQMMLDETGVKYVHHEFLGEGYTMEEAVEDWRRKLPAPIDKTSRLVWRVRPESSAFKNFDTKRAVCRVYARGVIVP